MSSFAATATTESVRSKLEGALISYSITKDDSMDQYLMERPPTSAFLNSPSTGYEHLNPNFKNAERDTVIHMCDPQNHIAAIKSAASSPKFHGLKLDDILERTYDGLKDAHASFQRAILAGEAGQEKAAASAWLRAQVERQLEVLNTCEIMWTGKHACPHLIQMPALLLERMMDQAGKESKSKDCTGWLKALEMYDDYGHTAFRVPIPSSGACFEKSCAK